MKSRSTEEMETTINFCRTEAWAEVWTSDTMMFTKFDRLCETAPDFYQCKEVARDLDGDIISKTYRITDKGLLSFRSGRVKRELTEEQRAALREQGRRNRAAQIAARKAGA